ncbi:M20/M25/M40 family metallo-hydrolase [Congregibacter litoralis]|uniref:Acetylornithine deacetylase/Succinyl-diaminopimelate desuccinylase n=1 Tax=Congregibacter litoralis KT71 TaxID=314285 RepID=A4A7U8_9GAMM|nr:M20/M25/M40 family metallo-hydrolase [Congregibacter litoralis]EAQ97743.1 Acetylornithine deacetylase/Succinyl-diaminopimelate desuccinylase [Congregibacter litoralis KT71]
MKSSSMLQLPTLVGSLLITALGTGASALNAADADATILPEYTAEMEALTADARVQTALDYVLTLEARSRQELIELTEIPAPPFKEDVRAAHFATMLKDRGLEDVTIDGAGNVIGRRPGKSGDKVVAYAAHLDTVFPEETDVTVKFEGNKMIAPGIGDNTRGLVTLLEVISALDEADIETEADVLFIGNVGEEGLGDLRGVKYLFRDGAEKIDTFIAVDGGNAERIVYGGVGSHRYRVTFKGPGGHSWGAFGLANPQHALGRAIALFDENAPSVTTVGEKTSYNVGRIGGGTSINSIPFEAWMEIDMRSGSQDKLDDIDAVLQAAIQTALKEENEGRLDGPALTVDVDRVGTRPAAKGDATAALVQRAMAATTALGVTPSLQISSTDSNLPISKGIPAVTMSRGGKSGKAHSLAEYWEPVDVHLGPQIGILTILAEAGLAD